MTSRPQTDPAAARKSRGAFFTPPLIAEHLASWAIGQNSEARILDPTSGDGAFLVAASNRLRGLGVDGARQKSQLFGVDVHGQSLESAADALHGGRGEATLLEGDFFAEATPAQLGGRLPWMDAVIGNPPFVRYHAHRGEPRARSAEAALSQGVRLSGLASSWAALLVHACAFLKPDGRVAMVLPSELLTVGYAEPIRRWLASRFAAVHLVLFEELQFSGAEEQVVLLVARGTGGCEAIALHQVASAEDLAAQHLFDSEPVALPPATEKWTNLLLPLGRRASFQGVSRKAFSPLAKYGSTTLGTVTGANNFFTLNTATRDRFGINTSHLKRIVPPGSRHLPGSRFTEGHWRQLESAGHRVWLLHPETDRPRAGLERYIGHGREKAVDTAYKCSIRDPWWRPPAVEAPDLFFTYMSHVAPRLVANEAHATMVNSLHGLTLSPDAPQIAKEALPLVSWNSLTMLCAELNGRAYGGGILKMEPREAGSLQVPDFETLEAAWEALKPMRSRLDQLLRARRWAAALTEIDRAVLIEAVGLSAAEVVALRSDAARFRKRRTGREVT